jgi:AsmA protein
VVRRKDGTMNFSDLAGGKEAGDGKASEPPNLRIAEVSIEKAQFLYRDEGTGQEANVLDLNLRTGRLDGQAPGDFSLTAHITGRKPDLDLRAQTSGALRFNLRKTEFGFDKFAAQLKGRIDQDSLAAEFSAPKLEVSPDRASGSAVKGAVQLKGQSSLDFSFTANVSAPPLSIELAGRLDESALKGRLGLVSAAPLKASFDLDIDRINVDRYAPAGRKEAKTDDRIDLSALRGKTVSGKLAVGQLTVRRAKLENLKAEIRLADGRLEVAPHSANLYGGTLSGAVSADANGNRIAIKEAAQNIAIGALLRDVAQKDVLDGRGNLSLDVQTAGGTVAAVKKALSGNARVEMKDGAIKGVNLADSARNVKTALGGKQAKADPGQKTDFSEMSASFKIANGVARNDDLKAASPFLRLGGAGNADIGNNTVDYLAKATLAATTKGQGGRDVDHVAGITIPVKLSGALDNPEWHVDYSALLGSAAGGVTETVKKGAGGVKDAASGVTDAVRGLFKRK